MQDRGLASYISELIGTFFLVFFVTSAVVLFVATGDTPQFGSDFAVLALLHAFLLFGLITMFGGVSGGHFNPAVTLAALTLRKIDPIDAAVYILAQLSGAVLGTLCTKFLLDDEGLATNYGTPAVSGLLGSPAQGAIVEFLGTFMLILVICVAALGARSAKDWAPLVIGTTLGFAVIVCGPLTGAALNPARWFGPALVSGEFGGFAGIWPYLVGPLLAGLAAAAIFRFVIEPGEVAETEPRSGVAAKATAAKTTGVEGTDKATGEGKGI